MVLNMVLKITGNRGILHSIINIDVIRLSAYNCNLHKESVTSKVAAVKMAILEISLILLVLIGTTINSFIKETYAISVEDNLQEAEDIVKEY